MSKYVLVSAGSERLAAVPASQSEAGSVKPTRTSTQKLPSRPTSVPLVSKKCNYLSPKWNPTEYHHRLHISVGQI